MLDMILCDHFHQFDFFFVTDGAAQKAREFVPDKPFLSETLLFAFPKILYQTRKACLVQMLQPIWPHHQL
jgi:hypothetical protein